MLGVHTNLFVFRRVLDCLWPSESVKCDLLTKQFCCLTLGIVLLREIEGSDLEETEQR